MRNYTNLNHDWVFKNEKDEKVNIPHTWNGIDGQDGGDDYYRGECLYSKEFLKPEFIKDEELVFIEFKGVNASCQVKINGKFVCSHNGGYSTFRANITDHLKDNNLLEVTVNNEVNDNVYPQMADFTFYGGIYRDVDLIVVNKDHISLDNNGGQGIRVESTVKENKAVVNVKTDYTGPYTIEVDIYDNDDNLILSGEGSNIDLDILNPHLWHGIEDPYMYKAVSTLNVNGKDVDRVETNFGIRTIKVDSNKGFFLNGKSYPLKGVSRHQDWKNIGNGITTEHHNRDLELIKEVGANAIRLAHYQHDQYFYDLCDKHGFLVWAEIPYISHHMDNGYENTVSQMTELITQNFNHPSIVTWGISNEITIKVTNRKSLNKNHQYLNDLCHTLDSTRPTTLACYAMCSIFDSTVHISDIVGYNLYLGWYVPGYWLNDLFIKAFHFIFPKRPLSYSEYGAEGMPNLHSSKPKRGDHTEEYQAKYHEYMLKCFDKYPFMWGTFVWNMFDFAADARNQGGEPGMNHKGLITFNREVKKDSFYLYKAWWSKDPFVHLCGRRYVNRAEKVTKIKVYSNQKEVVLYNNDRLIERKTGNKIFEFTVSLQNINEIKAVSGNLQDTIKIKQVENFDLSYKLTDKNSDNWMG